MPSSRLPLPALGLLLCGSAVHAGAQTPASTAAIRGVVVDSVGTALPFATVRVESLGREALTDAAGRFVVAGVSTGSHPVLVRQIGHAPWRGALTAAVGGEPGGGIDTIRLARLAVRLADVVVRPEAPCTVGGVAAGTDSATLAPLFAQVRLNGERLRLAAADGPSRLRYERRREYVNAAGAAVAVRTDTTLVRPGAVPQYAPGRVATRVGNRAWNLALPTPEVVGDSAFTRAHCFRYAGPDTVAGRPAHRVEFTPAASLGGADVGGALLLDATTLELRAATFRLVPASGDELPDTELETRYGVSTDGRPVTVATELRYRQLRPVRVDGQVYVRTVERLRLVP